MYTRDVFVFKCIRRSSPIMRNRATFEMAGSVDWARCSKLSSLAENTFGFFPRKAVERFLCGKNVIQDRICFSVIRAVSGRSELGDVNK
jgi:hypothetical protein